MTVHALGVTSNPEAVSRLRNRRAIGLVTMSALIPGSAQYLAGRRELGRIFLRVWIILVAALFVLLLAIWMVPGWVVAVLLHPLVSPVLKVAAWLTFLVWVGLLIDAWRLAKPPNLSRPNRLLLTLTCAALTLAAGLGTTLVADALTAVGNISGVFIGGGEKDKKEGRYNVLLLGVDAAEGRDGLRPDSINVASIDAETGRTVIFGLPRNMQRVPFPASSPLHEIYPEGYVCEGGDCMLNGVYTLADEEYPDLFPEDEGPGLVATTEAIEELTGLDINYYAMIDMGGFESLIDVMGGIHLDIYKEIPIGGVSTQVSGYIEPGENVLLDGYHALWFARSRHDSSDYERMLRQKCVMGAMSKQLDPRLMSTRFVELSEAGRDILSTDVGGSHLPELVDLALKGRKLDLITVDFSPPLIDTSDPDFDLLRATVKETIAESEALDEPGAEPEEPTQEQTETTAKTTPGDPDGDDLDEDDETLTDKEKIELICEVS